MDELERMAAAGERFLPPANDVDEVLDFDALDHAFKKEGENEVGNALALLLHIGSSKRKQEMLEGLNDTTFSMKTEDYIARIQEVGFKKVLELPFHTVHGGQERNDTFYIFWHKDGLFLCMDTYNGDRNSANIYFNYEPNDQRKIWEGLDYVSGGFNGEEGKYFFAGNIDAREGIKHHLETIRTHGKFLNPWKKQDFLWFLHYGDTNGKEYDGYDYKVINQERIAMLPREIQEAIRGE
jgi:hypothetical protein